MHISQEDRMTPPPSRLSDEKKIIQRPQMKIKSPEVKMKII